MAECVYCGKGLDPRNRSGWCATCYHKHRCAKCGKAAEVGTRCGKCRQASPRFYVTPPHIEDRITIYGRRALAGVYLFAGFERENQGD